MARFKHRNDQESRRMKSPTGLPGEPSGKHLQFSPGKKSSCNCGGCLDGKRIEPKPQVITLRTHR